jgi:hypothetical protein
MVDGICLIYLYKTELRNLLQLLLSGVGRGLSGRDNGAM